MFEKPFSNLFLAALAVFILASFAVVTPADARGFGGGFHGGGGFGGGFHGGGDMHANFDGADTRTNDVRSSSFNNVNINRNVNVNVDRGGCCYGGWNHDYHPVATAAAVGATMAVTAAVVGSFVRSVPVGCVPVNYSGMIYQQCGGGVWYQSESNGYIVSNPPY